MGRKALYCVLKMVRFSSLLLLFSLNVFQRLASGAEVWCPPKVILSPALPQKKSFARGPAQARKVRREELLFVPRRFSVMVILMRCKRIHLETRRIFGTNPLFSEYVPSSHPSAFRKELRRHGICFSRWIKIILESVDPRTKFSFRERSVRDGTYGACLEQPSFLVICTWRFFAPLSRRLV